MNAPPPVKNPVRTFGWPTLLAGLALLIGLIALTQPIWLFQRNAGGGDIDTRSYSWTQRTEEEWRNGVLASTTTTPYTSPSFDEFGMREVVGMAYFVGALYALLFGVLAALHYASRSRRIPAQLLFAANFLAFVVGLVATILPTFLIPSAATADVHNAVVGFSGSSTVTGDVLSWGAGSTWWLWIAALIPSAILVLMPLLRRWAWARLTPVQ